MSTLAGAVRPAPPRVALPVPPIVVRLAAFAALAAFCLVHYALLVEPAARGGALALTAVVTLGGAALAATALLPRRPGLAVRVVVLVVMAVAALAATGLAPRFVWPGNWDELRQGLDQGFTGLDSFTWPYQGGDHWVRLTLLLAMPLLAVPAAALAFWPARRAGVMRAVAIAPLLVAYGTAVADLVTSAWAARGLALLFLIAAYLWLPRLRGRDVLTGLVAVAACAVLALPLAAGLDAGRPWIDYRSWDWFSAPGKGMTFAWDHMYGPITWSRAGAHLLDVRSREPHYWKAETLDRFDGLRWIHSESPPGSGDPGEDIPVPMRQRWNERIRVTMRGLTSDVVIGAGTIYRVEGDRVAAQEPDGTVRIIDSDLRQGDSYVVRAYVPDPTARQMRAAPRRYPERLTHYVAFDLPARGQSGLKPPDLSETAREVESTPRTVAPSVANAPLEPADVARVEASPYGRVYALARRLAVAAPTTYDVVKSVESYLQHGFQYNEKPPARRYPLPAFLAQDKAGYCQQFSGAMALMLRMDGVPARVATGFSPGALNHVTGLYEVRDFDAHSWVEVWFSGIGWVPFDPTPSLAPAASQSSAASSPSAARGGRSDTNSTVSRATREAAVPAGRGGSDGGNHVWLLFLAAGALGAAAVGGLWLVSLTRARRHPGGPTEGAVDELRSALGRLGYAFPPRTTLAELERRLRVTVGEAAGRYVARLRAVRFAPPGAAAPPGPRERRELRRALTARRGPLARLRGLIALPPHPRRRQLES